MKIPAETEVEAGSAEVRKYVTTNLIQIFGASADVFKAATKLSGGTALDAADVKAMVISSGKPELATFVLPEGDPQSQIDTIAKTIRLMNAIPKVDTPEMKAIALVSKDSDDLLSLFGKSAKRVAQGIKAFMDGIKYDGVDIRVFRKLLKKWWKSGPSAADIDTLTKAIVLFLARGTKFSMRKISKTVGNGAGIQKVLDDMSALASKMGASFKYRDSITKDMLTPARIMAALPEVVAQVVSAVPSIDLDSFGVMYRGKPLPRVFCTSVSCSYVPKDEAYNDLRDACLKWTDKFSESIMPVVSKDKAKQFKKTAKAVAMTQLSSSVVSESAKLRILALASSS